MVLATSSRCPRGSRPVTSRVATRYADVGDHPVGARFDELVGPQAVDAAPHHRGLDADPVEQFAQRPGASVGVDVSSARYISGSDSHSRRLVVGVVAVGELAHAVTTPMVRSAAGRLK